jgi:MarR family transcriptional regulator for hemolysin
MAERTHKGIGPALHSTAQVVSRAFDRTLAEAGGSRPIWIVLLALTDDPAPATQRDLAETVGLSDATLTHHLRAMEDAGLVSRARGTDNRRVVLVTITPAGRAAYKRMLTAALAFDARLTNAVGERADDLLDALGVLRTAIADGEHLPPLAAGIDS